MHLFIEKVEETKLLNNATFISCVQNIVQHFSVKIIINIDEIVGDRKGGFHRYRSATDQIFRFHQVVRVKWDSMLAIYRLQGSLLSVRREVLFNISIKFCFPMKRFRLIKIYLNET